jgi:hypothetical protein
MLLGSPSESDEASCTQKTLNKRALSAIFGTYPALAGGRLTKRRPDLLQASDGT